MGAQIEMKKKRKKDKEKYSKIATLFLRLNAISATAAFLAFIYWLIAFFGG